MVRQGDPGDARGDGLLGVGDGLDPLQHDRAVPDRTQPLDVVPRQRRIELGLHLAGEGYRGPAVVDALVDDVRERDRLGTEEVERPAGMEGAVEDRLEPDLGRQREATADVALASPEHGGVDRQPQRLVPGGGRTLDQLTHETPVAPGVDLEPLGTVADGCDLLDRPCRDRRQRVRDAGAVRRSRHRQLALRVGDAGESRRGEDQGERETPAEQLGAGIDPADVAQHTRAELDPSERTDVASHRAFVLGAAVDVVEHAARESPPGDRTEVVDGRDAVEAALHPVELDRLEPDHRSERLDHPHAADSNRRPLPMATLAARDCRP